MTTLPVLDCLYCGCNLCRASVWRRDFSLCQQGKKGIAKAKSLRHEKHTQLEKPSTTCKVVQLARITCDTLVVSPITSLSIQAQPILHGKKATERCSSGQQKLTAMPNAKHTTSHWRTYTKPDSSALSENGFKHGGRNNARSTSIKFACVSQLAIEHQSTVHLLCASQFEQLVKLDQRVRTSTRFPSHIVTNSLQQDTQAFLQRHVESGQATATTTGVAQRTVHPKDFTPKDG